MLSSLSGQSHARNYLEIVVEIFSLPPSYYFRCHSCKVIRIWRDHTRVCEQHQIRLCAVEGSTNEQIPVWQNVVRWSPHYIGKRWGIIKGKLDNKSPRWSLLVRRLYNAGYSFETRIAVYSAGEVQQRVPISAVEVARHGSFHCVGISDGFTCYLLKY